MSWASVLADAVVVFHAAYVSFVVFGMAAIVLGLALGWSWVRNFWFRLAHVLAIGIVAAESMSGIACPLTVWERSLRERAGQGGYQGDFVGHWAHRLIFFRADPWVFTVAYIVFAAAVVLAFVFGPPRRPGRRVAERPSAS